LDGQWIDITGVADGNYTLELEVNPGRRLTESNYDNNITRIPITIGSAHPANDNFANAQGLSGSSDSVSGSNAGASKEPGEPNHADNAGGRSVWYSWTAPSGNPVTIDTIGSGFDTLLGVYTGSSVDSLTTVARNDDISSTTRQSRLSFTPLAGATYQIAVDGKSGVSGNLVLTLDQSAVNDDFANCEFIGGASGSITGSNGSATKETGEPSHAGNQGGKSIWYCWTAPNTGTVTFDTIGSTFDTLLAVYVGGSVNSLVTVASNDDIADGYLQSRVTFAAVATTQYHVAIDGYDGASGNTKLNWNPGSDTSLLLQHSAFGSSLAKSMGDTSQPPEISCNFLSVGEYELAIAGRPLHRYTVEVSDDLTQWTPLATSLADHTGIAYFRDKATIRAHREAGDNLGAAGPIGSGFDDPVCRVPSTSNSTGGAGLAGSRFYRVRETR
jgi:hypothetical protein